MKHLIIALLAGMVLTGCAGSRVREDRREQAYQAKMEARLNTLQVGYDYPKFEQVWGHPGRVDFEKGVYQCYFDVEDSDPMIVSVQDGEVIAWKKDDSLMNERREDARIAASQDQANNMNRRIWYVEQQQYNQQLKEIWKR